MDAEGYKGAGGTYASDYQAYGVGAAYTLAPGLVVQTEFMYIDEELRAAPNAARSATKATSSSSARAWISDPRV